jgi:hypothetical protein
VRGAADGIRRAWAPVDRFVARRAALGTVALVAAVVFAVQAVAWPIDDTIRRDSADYLLTFLELGEGDPLFEPQMLARTPVAPFVLGGSMALGGPTLLEIVMGGMFVTSATALFAALRRFGSLLAVIASAMFLLSFDVAALYHQVGSDALFATGLAVLALALARAWLSASWRAFAVAGVVGAVCVLTRPSGLVAIPVVAACSLAVPATTRRRLACAAAFVAAAGALLAVHATVNAIRYGEFVVSHHVAPAPLYRLYVKAHLVSPTNGSASAELGEAVEALAATEPYRSYGVTADRVLREGTNFMSWDLVWLARRTWGDDASARLRAVLMETVRAHPREVARGALETLLFYLRSGYVYPAPSTSEPEQDELGPRYVAIGGQKLREPHAQELIPLPHIVYGWASDPSGGYVYDWRDPLNPELRFTDPVKQRRYAERQSRLARWDDELPPRDGSTWLADRMNGFVATFLPTALFWLVVGVVALALRRPAYSGFFVTLLLAGLSVDILHAISMPELEEYGLPSVPLIVVFALGALFARKRRPTETDAVAG